MDFESPRPTPRKHSLGSLRKANKTKDKSPDLTGQLILQRDDFERIAQEFAATNGQEISCDLAAWTNHDSRGPFLTVQVSPRYVPKQKQAATHPDLDYFFNGGDRSHLSD
jgi:hypothetical protein